MRLKQSPPPWNQHRSNGNTAQLLPRSQQAAITRAPTVFNNHWNNTEIRFYDHSTRLDTITDLNNGTNNFTYNNSNVTNAIEVNPTAEYSDYTSSAEQTSLDNLLNSLGDKQVCNRQYRESLTKSVHFVNKNIQKNVTLEGNIVSQSEDSEVAFVDNQITPHDEEERMLEQSDTDETSDSAHLRPVPRGIVNPNYPGFQHLAHTLQDYSKDIDNFYHSENEMTDDDLDAEFIDLTYDAKDEEIFRFDINSVDPNLSNNNNHYDNNETRTNSDELKYKNNYVSNNEDEIQKLCVDVITKNNINETPMDEVPDLLKNVNTRFELANNNVDDSVNKESICLDTDIENNFSVTNIIGDFNKEVEDEINNIFKCNLHFQDDLRELRKDIEVAFKKPIEDTINHISEVVNQVIKHLVTEHEENREIKSIKTYSVSGQCLQIKTSHISEDSQISKENESNIKKEMKQSRPTFLFIENNINSKTLDAFLSDAKDELQMYDDAHFEKGNLCSNTIVSVQNAESDLSQFPHSLQEIKIKVPTSPLNSVDYVNTPIGIDDNSNDISAISIIGKLVKSLEEPGQSNVSKTDDKTPSNVRTKEELSQGAKEKDVDTSIAQENASRTKPIYKLRRERRNSGGASSSGARQRDKAQAKQSVQSKDKCEDTLIGSFDVYNIETAMPKLDLDAIESHLRAAKEAERRKRNDREEIRRRLAMGTETDECGADYRERPGRKPSLHSRLQSGMNLQICFMNETVSDNESQASDSERSPSAGAGGGGAPAREAPSAASSYLFNHPYKTRPLSTSILRNNKSSQGATAKTRPSSLSLKPSKPRSSQSLGHVPLKESDLYALQATLQTEARIALAQAKEMARIQMERERQCRAASPVTEMLRKSLEKANNPLAADRRRVSRQLLTHMNIAQLQVIVNSLHGEVELLSEALVRLLMSRDELHMGQDSMLVDIEDLTRYLGVKEPGKKGKAAGVRRFASLVHN